MTILTSGISGTAVNNVNQPQNSYPSEKEHIEAPLEQNKVSLMKNAFTVQLSVYEVNESMDNSSEELDSDDDFWTQKFLETLKKIREKGLVKWYQEMERDKVREMVLKQMGLSEGDLKGMPPEEREKVEKEIQQRISEFYTSKARQDAKNAVSDNKKVDNDTANVEFMISLKA